MVLFVIEIYSEFNKNFEQNGNMTLFPISCQIEANLNSEWILTLEHPIDELGRYKHIQSGSVLKATSFNGEQLFRVYAVERTNDSVIAEAQPIFMDAMNEVFIVDKRPTNKNGQETLNYLLDGTKYSAESNILNLNTAYYINKNLLEAINGDDENSFINRWGGEIIFDNYKIVINNHAGRDKGVLIKYGKNLVGINEQVNRSDLITRIVPKGFNGIMLSGSSPWVDSPKIRSYPIIYTKVVEFSDVKVKQSKDDEEGFDTLAEAQAELRRLSKLEFSENRVDEESVQLEIDLILLQNAAEYKEYKVLEDISLGDTVRCVHSKLDINVRLKCIGLTWDCLTQRVSSVVLGNPQPTYFDNNTETTSRVEQVIRPDGSVIADKVQGTLDAFNTQLIAQNSVAQKQNVRAILFEDLDFSSPTYGAMSLGTQGLQVAKKRTLDGLGWDWRTAITAKGITADVISAGILQGIEILADRGNIGGWKIDEHGLYTDFEFDDKNSLYDCNRVYLQNVGEERTWAISIQKRKKENGKFYGDFFTVFRDGSFESGVKFRNYPQAPIVCRWNQTDYNMMQYTGTGNLMIGSSVQPGQTNFFVGNANRFAFIFPETLLNIMQTTVNFGDDWNDSYTDKVSIATDNNLIIESNGGKGDIFVYSDYINLMCYANILGGHVYNNFTVDNTLYVTRLAEADKYANINALSILQCSKDLRLNFRAVSGTIPLVVDSNGTITVTSSSERYKTRIVSQISDKLSPHKLYELPVKEYEYKKEFKTKQPAGGRQVGLIAEDVRKYYPKACVFKEGGEVETWQERLLIPPMLKLIQEQKQTLDEHEKLIKNLENKISELEKKLNDKS